MKRPVIRILLLLVVLALGWYLLLKEDHYTISFTYGEPPGIVLENLKTWHKIPQQDIEPADDEALSANEYSRTLKINDSTFSYRWKIKGTSDGESDVTVSIKDNENDLKQKLQVPFVKNDFVKRSIRTVTEVTDAFKAKAKTYRVHNIKDSLRNSEFCAYISLSSTTGRKASTMLQNIAVVMDYVKINDIPLSGDPFLELTHWDRKTDSIQFDFCFPLARKDSLPPTDEIKFKESKSFKGMKANFNGNYRDSHRAWLYLLDQAERTGKNVSSLPVEIFRNDPHEGGDPLKWKALIYLPLDN